MSEAVFARFPRFDGANGGVPQAPAKGADTAPPADEADQAKAAMASQLAAIEATLASLSKTSETLSREANEQAVAQTVMIAKTLFPELGRRFLADEIGQHLPSILPQNTAQVTLRAEPELAAQLKEMVARSPKLEAICSVVEDEAPGANRVEASWGKGGVDIDFAGLLEACVRQLESAHTKPGDKS